MSNLTIKDPPVFTEQIYKVKKEDYITAELENAIKEALLNNDIFLKRQIEDKMKNHNTEETAHADLFSNVVRYRSLATRIRNPEKPDYGLGGGGEWSGTLETAPYSGTAEVTIVVNDTEYDGTNISRNWEEAPNGTIILMEE